MAIVVVGPGGVPATLTLELREAQVTALAEDLPRIYGLADAAGKPVGSFILRLESPTDEVELMAAGEDALKAAQAVAQQGAAFGALDQEEAELVSRLIAQGKTRREIEIALDDFRASRLAKRGDRRNATLPEELRTSSKRSRAAGIADDPALKAIFDRYVVSLRDMQVHHLIPMEAVRTFPDLFTAAARAGWRPDAPGNLVALPKDDATQRQIKQELEEDRGIHRGPHPNWNAEVIRKIRQDIEPKLPDKDDPGYDAAVKRAVERYQDELRRKLPTKKVTMREIDQETT